MFENTFSSDCEARRITQYPRITHPPGNLLEFPLGVEYGTTRGEFPEVTGEIAQKSHGATPSSIKTTASAALRTQGIQHSMQSPEIIGTTVAADGTFQQLQFSAGMAADSTDAPKSLAEPTAVAIEGC